MSSYVCVGLFCLSVGSLVNLHLKSLIGKDLAVFILFIVFCFVFLVPLFLLIFIVESIT